MSNERTHRLNLGKLGSVRLSHASVSVAHHRTPDRQRRTAWWVCIQLGKGAGTRWIDQPGYQNSIHAPWYRRQSVRGRTLYIGRWAKPNYLYRQQDDRNRWGRVFGASRWSLAPFYVTGLSRRCNRDVYPGWY